MLDKILSGSSPIYPLWGIFISLLSLILINKKDYQYLLPHGILGAIILSLFLYITIHFIEAWKYVDALPYSVAGIPVFIFIAWFAAIIIFLWALPKTESTWVHYLYIGLYSFTGVIIDATLHNLELRPYANWYRAWMWFFVLYLVFWINYKIYLLRKQNLN